MENMKHTIFANRCVWMNIEIGKNCTHKKLDVKSNQWYWIDANICVFLRFSIFRPLFPRLSGVSWREFLVKSAAINTHNIRTIIFANHSNVVVFSLCKCRTFFLYDKKGKQTRCESHSVFFSPPLSLPIYLAMLWQKPKKGKIESLVFCLNITQKSKKKAKSSRIFEYVLSIVDCIGFSSRRWDKYPRR